VALNPSHNKAVATGTGILIVPVDKADDFKANLERYDLPLVTWTTYQAHRGESLDAIAKRHHTTAAQLKAANGEIKLDKKARLRAAGPVMVPIKRDANAPIKVAQLSTLDPAAPRSAQTVSDSAPGSKLYIVRPGDNLYAIAQRHRTSVATLMDLNRLTAKAVLQPGLKLRLP
jgi:membrane-bound lytic murein transglycosylase D